MAKPIINQQLEEIRDAILGLPTSGVQEAVNDWLDDHPEAVSTVDFSIATKVFNTVAQMIADTTLAAGNKVATCGYYESGDNGGTNYVISATHTGTFYITLANGLYANRLEENKKINADQIGIKHYATQELAEADTDGMDSNHTIAQTALNAGFSLVFGEGFYAFDDYLQMKNAAQGICGSSRSKSTLVFPNGNGIDFNLNVEYDYVEIKDLTICAYGNCIDASTDCRYIVYGKFENLVLKSETGNGFIAPAYNRNIYNNDTCVWSCLFSGINAFCENGAIAVNVKGLGNWFYNINQCGDTKIAFKNCTGVFERFDTLTTDAQYAFYYDQAADYDMKLTLIDFHYEGISKSFVYFTDEAAVQSAIGILAINSGITRPQMENSDIPFIKVGELLYYYHFGGYNMYPYDESLFDLETLGGAIIHAHEFQASTYKKFKTNIGHDKGFKIFVDRGTSQSLYVIDHGYTGVRNDSNAYSSGNYELYEKRRAMDIRTIYGGKQSQVLMLTDSSLPDGAAKNLNIKTINDEYLFCDCIVFKLTSDTTDVKIRSLTTGDLYPGKRMTLINDATSTKNVKLEGLAGSTNNGFKYSSDIIIAPGETIHLMLDYHYINGVQKTEWSPYTLSYNPT